MNLQEAFDAGFDAVKAYVDGAIGAFEARVAALEKGAPPADGKDGAAGAPGAPGRGLSKLLIDANGHLVAAFTDGTTDDVGLVVGKDGKDGRDGGDGAPGEKGIDGIIGRDGIDGARGAPGERGADGAVGKEGPAGRDGADGTNGVDGKSVELETVADLVRSEVEKIAPDLVQKAVDAIPRPANGRDGAAGERGADGAPGRDGIDGKDGAAGKLPLVKAWLDTVHREGEIVTHEGGTYQANRDTGKAPPHADWTCLAAPGRNGLDARSIVVRGTHSDDAEYSALDLVAMNGGSFIAKRDNPGPCPGEGWQLVASQGKAGKPGDRGAPGPIGRGEPGAPVIAASIDGNGLLTLVNGDGSTVECDMYPVLAKIGAN